MSSAIGGARGRMEGLRAGCDDHLAKSYALGCRADRTQRLAVLRVTDRESDIRTQQASRAGQPIRLQHREFLLPEK